jgi:HEAT repeat protein
MMGFFLPPDLPNPKAAIIDAQSSSADVRWVAASALGRVNGELKDAAVNALKNLLADEAEEVRAQAVEGLLEQCQSDSSIDINWVSHVLSDESPAVRCAAVDAALALFNTPGESMVLLLRDPDPSVRMVAASAVGEIGDRAACGALYPLLRDVDGSVRTRAAQALAFLGDSTAEESLLCALSASSADLDEVIRALGSLKSKAAIPLLRKIVGKRFQDAGIKAQAAVSLYACTDGDEGRPEIERFLFARKTDVKIRQMTALFRLPVEGLASRVAELIEDNDELVVSTAIETLVALSCEDKDALPALISRQGQLTGALADELKEAIEECRGEHRAAI